MSAHYPDLTTRDFDSAFAEARRRRLDFFRWSGKTYHTRRADGKSFAEARADLCAPSLDKQITQMMKAAKRLADLSTPTDERVARLEAENARLKHALVVWDAAHRTGRNEPLQTAFEIGKATLVALRDMGVE